MRDAEVLEMLATLLDELGVKNWRLELNSVGSTEDRKRYDVALRAALEPVKAQLCEDNQRRAETNPLRVLDSKEPADQEIINALPKIADYLDEDSRAHFAAVRATLDACGVPYTVNPRLVRGLDYYTRTTFEFTVPDGSGLGTQNALLGGGRYDGLSEMLGGPKAPGIGFAIGEDRLILVLQEQEGRGAVNAPHPEWMWAKELDAYIAPMGAERNAAALALARELRRAGLSVEVGDGTFRLKKSFEAADKVARHIVILGEDELLHQCRHRKNLRHRRAGEGLSRRIGPGAPGVIGSITLHVLLIVFLATLIRSTFGFGEALIAVPLLALILPVAVAAPLAVLLSVTIAAIVVVQDWHKIHLRSAGWLLAPTLLGIPLGIALLTSAHQQLVKAMLALVILAFSGYSLAVKNPPQLHDDHRAWLLGCGFLAGILGGAYGMNGPPLVIYGAMRRWSPQHFRATLQGYFLPASLVAMAGFRLTGLWTASVTHYYLISLPAAIPAIFLGRWINHRLHGESFLKVVHAGLICIGLILLLQAIRGLNASQYGAAHGGCRRSRYQKLGSKP